MTDNKRAADDAIEYAIQILSQVEAGDGVFVGDCSKAIKGLSAALPRADGGKDSSDARDAERYRCLRNCYSTRERMDVVDQSDEEMDSSLDAAITKDKK